MNAIWKKNKKLKPKIILAKIDSLTIVSNGRVSYEPFERNGAMAALINMVNFSAQCEGLDQERIVSDAVNLLASSGELEEKSVIDEINTMIGSKLASRDTEYYLLTSISLQSPFPFKQRVIDGVKIRILTGDYPKKYSGRDHVVSKFDKISKTPDDYTRVIVSVKAKSLGEAETKALKSLNLLRGVFCLVSNPADELFDWVNWEPINRVRLGGVHTVHERSGKVLPDRAWFEPRFSPRAPFRASNPDEFSSCCKWMLDTVDKLVYRDKMKDSLLRFADALDERDQNVAIVKLWSALEVLFHQGGTNYDQITKRCSSLYKEKSYHQQILEHLREYRNSSVHTGVSSDKGRSNCFLLQSYFRKLVLFHFENQGEFKTLEEANSFLDLPHDLEALENKKRLIDKAIRFVT